MPQNPPQFPRIPQSSARQAPQLRNVSPDRHSHRVYYLAQSRRPNRKRLHSRTMKKPSPTSSSRPVHDAATYIWRPGATQWTKTASHQSRTLSNQPLLRPRARARAGSRLPGLRKLCRVLGQALREGACSRAGSERSRVAAGQARSAKGMPRCQRLDVRRLASESAVGRIRRRQLDYSNTLSKHVPVAHFMMHSPCY
jgi:hypothetical protein